MDSRSGPVRLGLLFHKAERTLDPSGHFHQGGGSRVATSPRPRKGAGRKLLCVRCRQQVQIEAVVRLSRHVTLPISPLLSYSSTERLWPRSASVIFGKLL